MSSKAHNTLHFTISTSKVEVGRRQFPDFDRHGGFLMNKTANRQARVLDLLGSALSPAGARHISPGQAQRR
jgi:hypothetical protein